MAHGYRTLQQWNQWLTRDFLGGALLEAELAAFTRILNNHFGKHAVLIGVPQQYSLLPSSVLPCHTLATPLIHGAHGLNCIETDFHDLPLLTGSVDLVMLPHTLEFIDNPRQLLSEACRVIKPEGLIAIASFNPYSIWGMRRWFAGAQKVPWKGHFINERKVRNWLRLAEFQMEKQTSVLYGLPIDHPAIFNRLKWLDPIGNVLFPKWGGVHILLARAKQIPLTPIKLKWKQQLNGIPMGNTFSGHIAGSSRPASIAEQSTE